jgi:hypothetical protein
MIRDIRLDCGRLVQNFIVHTNNDEVVIPVSCSLLSDVFGIEVGQIALERIPKIFRSKIIELAKLIVSNKFNWLQERYAITNDNYHIFNESEKKFLDSLELLVN